MSIEEQRRSMIREGEGSISHMYLDTLGLVRKFPSFTRAARAEDWVTCARECHRQGIGDRRNDEVRELFESASAGGAQSH